jgi:hypothetical protein
LHLLLADVPLLLGRLKLQPVIADIDQLILQLKFLLNELQVGQYKFLLFEFLLRFVPSDIHQYLLLVNQILDLLNPLFPEFMECLFDGLNFPGV